MLSYNLESRGSKNLYEALYSAIREDIETGNLAANTHLPSKRDLARSVGVSVITIEHAYRQLIAEGYVRSEQRRGYFVNDLGAVATPAHAKTFPNPPAMIDVPVQANQTTARYNFTGSGILPSSFPYRAWHSALRDVMDRYDDQALLGSAPATGLPQLRNAIAKHVRESRGINASPDCIVIGAGAQFLYGLIAQLIGQNSQIAVEDPGYPRLSKIYQSVGINTHFVGLDEQGIIVNELEKSGANLVHTMPSHHFPTGTVMPVSRRYELLGWAAQSSNRYIIEDDYDCEFRHIGKPIPALRNIDVSGKVIYLNTFTKSLGPGMRISYMILPEHLMERFSKNLGFYSSSVSNIDQLTLAAFMESGQFDRHVNRMRRMYRSSRDAAIKALEEFDLANCVEGQDAGLHFLLKLPEQAGIADSICAAVAKQDVAIMPLSWYCSNARPSREALLVNYSSLDAQQAAEGIRIIAKEISKFA